MNSNKKTESVVFAGGCFWCTEAIFKALKGVTSVMPGYAGGTVKNPSYEQVCTGTTGHAEAIKIDFDSSITSFRDLLEVFFSTHDPTQLNRQGNDVGTQYRSAVFYGSERQKQDAEKFIGELTQEKVFSSPIVTTLEPLTEFYEAENYHRDYFAKNPNQPYCMLVINPKLDKFKKKYLKLLK
jgi:peptide-methionine (S)-S-oxide reductase